MRRYNFCEHIKGKMMVYDVVIIGGGVIGCSTAFHLAEKGQRSVVVIERDFLASGSTGRCGGGIRAQWSTEGNIRLAQASISEFERFKELTGQDIQFRQGGYLLPAYTDETARQFKENVALQKRYGVPVEIITPEEAARITPAVQIEQMRLATFCPTDGVANPFLVVKGYSEAAKKMGVTFLLREEVVAFETEGDRISAVLTGNGTKIGCGAVLNAAGPWAGLIAQKASVNLPLQPFRHQILVTEPTEIFHQPMVIDLDHNLYFCQQEEGGIVAGQTDEDEPPSFNIRNSHRFVVDIARKLTFHNPRLGALCVVRQWAGLYTMTPDAQPILGQVGERRNFFCACGFSGHGFMLSPAVGQVMAQLLMGEAPTLPIDDYSVERFRAGKITREKWVV